MKKLAFSVSFLLLLHPAYPSEQTEKKPQFFIIDSWISGFIYGIADKKAVDHRWKNAWKRANRSALNDIKITAGLFIADRHRKFFGKTLDISSRLTYQLPQTILGWGYAQFENSVAGNVDRVQFCCGSTVLTGRKELFFGYGGPAVTLGSYLIGDEEMEADPDNTIFQHEYGHYLQSRAMGFAYLSRIAIPSILSEHGNYKAMYSRHDFHPTELDANRRGFLYFNRISPTFMNDSLLSAKRTEDNCGWDFKYNPLYHCGEKRLYRRDSIYYVDYSNPVHVASLEKLKVAPKVYDYTFPVLSGFFNSYHYNNPSKKKKP